MPMQNDYTRKTRRTGHTVHTRTHVANVHVINLSISPKSETISAARTLRQRRGYRLRSTTVHFLQQLTASPRVRTHALRDHV